jgi:hypothetical protein
MRSELPPRYKEIFSHTFYLFLLLALSLLSVRFPMSARGKSISKIEDLAGFLPPEQRVGKKLLELGFQPLYEKRQILLDEGVVVAKYKNSDRDKKKALTSPDFYIVIDGIECFIEVGASRVTSHKRDQRKVAQSAIHDHLIPNMLYVQLFNGDIDDLEDMIHTEDELLEFLYNLSDAVYFAQA